MRYPPVGFCIYCGSRNVKLGEEHIIPYALNGAMVLPMASCKKCEKETHSYEYTVCRKIFGNFRIRYNVRSRRKKERPSHIEIGTITKDGKHGKALVPAKEHPVTLFLYKFEESDYLKGNREEDSKFNWVPISIFSNKELDELIQKYNWDRKLEVKMVPVEFARMLAKIAYSFAVAEVTLEGFTSFQQLIEVILNRSNNISYLIGGDWDIPAPDPAGFHHLGMTYTFRDGYVDVIVQIRLFPAFETPLYRVVVGRIDLNSQKQKQLLDKKLAIGIQNGTVEISGP